MKDIIIIILLFTGLTGYSQMAPAVKMPPDLEENVKINAPAQEVWDYLMNFDNIQEFGSEIIAVSETMGQERGAMRFLTYKNGSKRTEEIAIIASDKKQLGIKVLSLDDIYSQKFYYFVVAPMRGSKCVVTMESYYQLLDKKDQDREKARIIEEFQALLRGLKNQFE